MTWTCSYEKDQRCSRRNAPCQPGAKGCVLCDRFAFVAPPEDTGKEGAPRRTRSRRVSEEEVPL